MIFQAKEHPAVPARSGDGTGDGRKRFVGAPLPVEAVGCDGDDLFNALPLAQQPCARDGTIEVGADAALLFVATVQFLAQPFQSLDRLWFQAAISQFLDAVRETALQVTTIERWRLTVEQVAPLLFQVWGWRGLERGQAGGNGILFGHAFLR